VRAALALAGAAMLGGCASTEPWPDRPWIDFGCDAPGPCRVRGRLETPPRGTPPYRGVLRLDDGRCLFVDLTGKFVERGPAWNGRRVAIRGLAVVAQGRGPLPVERCDGSLLLYADRLSLKGDR
jgi:hypothetical protein